MTGVEDHRTQDGDARTAVGRVRLVDVAARAGVSMKTVSNVVHGYPHVRPEVRTRVQTAIADLGYRPNLSARRLVTGRTGMLALALPEMDHPYYAEIARHVAECAPELGYRVMIEQTMLDAGSERAVMGDRDNGVVDGVLFHPVRMGQDEIASLRDDLPLVLLGEDAPATTDHVMIDNVAAARDVVAHLVARGRRRIGFLGTVADEISSATAPRLQGYHEALDAAGVLDADRPVLACSAYTADAAADALTAALAAGLEVDGLLCREDRFAVGALQALDRAGLTVPDDVAVVGWDDTHLCRWSRPRLTSVSPDKVALARTALRMVAERVDGWTGPGRHVVVPHRLVVREST